MNQKRNRKASRGTLPPVAGGAYYLRGIPPELWEPVMAKAKAEGRNIRWVILQALRDWLDGLYEPAQRDTSTHAPSARL